MTEAAPEPAVEPAKPDEETPDRPKAPDLPDPAFPEVLPGGEEAPDATPDESD
jgi:hypothetical protein